MSKISDKKHTGPIKLFLSQEMHLTWHGFVDLERFHDSYHEGTSKLFTKGCDMLDDNKSAAHASRECWERNRTRNVNMPVDYLTYGYAAMVAAGGVVGYAKAGKNICTDTLMYGFVRNPQNINCHCRNGSYSSSFWSARCCER